MPAFAVQALRSADLPFEASFDQPVGSDVRVLRPEAIRIRFVGDNNSFRHIPAWQVLDGAQDPPFENEVVLIGFTAGGLGDQWFTPFAETGRKMSGVEIHANAIDTLYAGRAIRE